MGVQYQLKTGDSVQMAEKNIYAMTQSLDKMQEFLKASFYDHLAILSEYVIFLARNTGFNQMERLSVSMTQVQKLVKASDKMVNEVKKESLAVKNKADELKVKVFDFSKLIEKLKAKHG